jgi:hypothetical protein
MLHAQGAAGRLEAVSGEATAAVGQHVGDGERKGGDRLFQESGSGGFRLLVLDRQMDHPRGAVDGGAHRHGGAGVGVDLVHGGSFRPGPNRLSVTAASDDAHRG